MSKLTPFQNHTYEYRSFLSVCVLAAMCLLYLNILHVAQGHVNDLLKQMICVCYENTVRECVCID